MDAPDNPTATPDAARRARVAKVGALVSTAVLAAVSVCLLLNAEHRGYLDHRTVIPWWLLAAAFAAAERWSVHLEVENEVYSFTLSEVPLTVGLFYASPTGVVTAYAIGTAIAFVTQVRSVRKVAFSAALVAAAAALSVNVFGLLAPSARVTSPSAWLAAFGAVAAHAVLSTVCVTAIVRLHGGRHPVGPAFAFAGLTTLANTSLALNAVVLLHVTLVGGALIAVVAAVLALVYGAYMSLARRYASLQLLFDFTRAVGGAQRAEDVLNAILDQARRALRASSAGIVLLTSDSECFSVEASEDGAVVPDVIAPSDAALWAPVVQAGLVVLVRRQTRNAVERAIVERLSRRDLIAVPLRVEGTPVGYIAVADRMGELATFDTQDARLLETLANHASVAIENGRLTERLAREIEERARQAATDALTGLPNRGAFVERLSAALVERRFEQCVAVLLMDLDHFKDVNDTLGHDVGDELLCQTAARATAALDGTAHVARLGGDEFAVLLTTVPDETAATNVAHAVRAVLTPPFHVRGVALEMSASVGIALAPMHGNDAHSLLKRADIAMYAAKREPNGVQVYDAASDENSVQRLALVGALREAIDKDELLVYFQPKVRIADEQVIGAEALVRWQHPQHGMLSPDVFIGIAERTGLIGALTTVVARRAINQCSEWRRRGFDLSIAVNISVHSLLDADFPEQIASLLDDGGLAAEHLTLEITESVILDPKRTLDALHRLASLGVRLSVDDFGTGYSSLTYLQRLPVHEVKVDRSFVMTMGTSESDAAIVKSIIDLGHNLGLRVVAEGVEDRVAWDRLARQGCDVAQGYFMSKPIPAEAFTSWLQEWEPQRIQPVAEVERAVTALTSWR